MKKVSHWKGPIWQYLQSMQSVFKLKARHLPPQRLPKDACRMPARLSTARLETRPWAICPQGQRHCWAWALDRSHVTWPHLAQAWCSWVIHQFRTVWASFVASDFLRFSVNRTFTSFEHHHHHPHPHPHPHRHGHDYLQVMHQSHPPGTSFTTALAEWVDRRSPWAAVVYQMLQDWQHEHPVFEIRNQIIQNIQQLFSRSWLLDMN